VRGWRKMKNADLIQTIFLAFLIVIFVKVFDFFFNHFLFAFNSFFSGIISIWLLINIAGAIILIYPKVLNLKWDKQREIYDYFKKFLIWSCIIWFLILFISGFILAYSAGQLPGLEALFNKSS